MNYVINSIRDFSFDTYLKCMKVKYEELSLYLKDNQIHLDQDPNKDIILEEWDNILPLSVTEAFSEQNQEKRRVMFWCIGPSKLFKELNPSLIDRTVLKIKNKTWDATGKETIQLIDDIYELYELDEKILFPPTTLMSRINNDYRKLRVVKCCCTTTGREYWIFIEDQVAMGIRMHINGKYAQPMKNAIQAIAWTFKVGVLKNDIEAIYRQGDCLIIKAKANAQQLPPEKWYHLDEETYRTKLIAQS